MPLVAVARHRHHFGVEGESDDWRAPKGSERNGRVLREGHVGIGADYEVSDLGNALEREYRTDAHLVPYILRDPRGASMARQPRINKQGLAFVRGLGFSVTVEVLLADIDNPGHVPWTDELREHARKLDAKLATAGVYYSANGRRIVQPLTRPVEVDAGGRVEHVLAAWLRELTELGYHPDDGCQDWTRHFRLPHVKRAGKYFARAELVDLSRMQPIDPPEPAPLLNRRRKVPRLTGELVKAGPVDDAPLAAAFAAAGWLGPSLGHGKRIALCPFRALHTTGRDGDSSTIIFGATPATPIGWWHCSHGHCAGRSQADVVDALPEHARLLLPAAGEKPKPKPRERELVDKGAAAPLLERAFRAAPDGLSVVIAGCGTGKTEAAIAIAVERAKSPGGGPKRAPAHSKTAISVPTTKLSVEVYKRIQARGEPVRRLFGPLSMRRADGSPECAIHENAAAFSKGGLSVPWELCEGRGKQPCEYADTCQARGGVEGPDDARIIVGPHKLLSRLDAAAGKTGLLVIDEPPAFLQNEVLTSEQLVECARGLREYFDHRYAAALEVSLSALAGWIATAPLDKPGPLADGVARVDPALLEEAYRATGGETAVECARAAFPPTEEDGPERRSSSPPVQRQWAYAARRSLYVARTIGEASKVARIVWTALTCKDGGAIARVEERGGRRVLVVTLPEVQLREAMRREGQVVVADAGGAQHLGLYKLVVGYEPPVTEVYVGDGAEIRRTLLRRRASRKGFLRHGRLVVDGSLARSVELAVKWLEEELTPRAAIVTFLPLALLLRATLGEQVGGLWLMAGQLPEVLDEGVRRLSPILARLHTTLDVGHYGAVRGLDHWRGHDALVTLGDPWPQLADSRWETELLRLGNWEGRLEQAAQQELEQAHGRLRTVHRDTPARALHVGLVRPGGWGGDVEVRDDRGGQPRHAGRDAVRAMVERLGGVAQAARELGMDRKTVRRYLS